MKWIYLLAVSTALAQQPPPAAPGTIAAPAAAPAPDSTPPPAEKPLSPANAMRASIERQKASLDKQREAVRKQAENAGAWRKPGDPISPIEPMERADCDPIADSVIGPVIEANAKSQNVKPELLRAVIERESGFRPCAVSSKGAQGLMQLMPATSQEMGVSDPFDPKENVTAGAKFLKQLMDKYKGDLSKALAAYNAGSAAVDQAGGVPAIQETKDYVDAILKKLLPTRAAPPNIQMPKPIEN